MCQYNDVVKSVIGCLNFTCSPLNWVSSIKHLRPCSLVVYSLLTNRFSCKTWSINVLNIHCDSSQANSISTGVIYGCFV